MAWTSSVIFAVIAYAGLLTASLSILKMNKENNVQETKRIS